jgi:hypothetical protein
MAFMKHAFSHKRSLPILTAAVGALFASAAISTACPFCSVESQTLSEETEAADAVVLAKLVKEAPATGSTAEGFGAADANTGTAKFEVVEVLRGDPSLQPGAEIDVVYFGGPDPQQLFLITGVGTEKLDWITPLPLSEAAVEYSRKLSSIPKTGGDRLAFFQDYLEHEDPLLAQDAYDEFARAPYADLHELRPRMFHDRLLKWIVDPEVSPSRRRLYFTMLGVCGTKEDVPLLETMITSDYAAKQPFIESLIETGLLLGGPVGLPAWIEMVKLDERRKKLGLDALVACYLNLRGPDGLDLIDATFLKNPAAEYTYIYSTVMALRFHGDEDTSVVPRERLLASMRLLLDNPDFADQVPMDLSRWNDWSVLDRLVAMYKASDKHGYIRQPVVSYLLVASEQPGEVGEKAKAALADLEQLDPDGVKQARSLAAFGALGRARAASPANAAAEAASSAPVDEKPASDAEAGQGYGASAADVQAAAEAEPAKIPDPSDFQEGSQVSTQQENLPKAQAGSSDQAAGDASDSQAVPSEDKTVANNSAAVAAAAPSVAAIPALGGTEVPASEPNRPLIIGLPLVAAALLMGVYWVVLKYGAV